MSSSADRMRWHRERERDGKLALRVVLDEVEVTELLIREDMLAPDVDHNAKAIAAALAAFIAKLCEWPG